MWGIKRQLKAALRGAQRAWRALPKPVRDYYIGILSAVLIGGGGAVEKSGLIDLTPGFEIPGISVDDSPAEVLPPSQERNTNPKTLRRDISGARGLLQVGFEDVAFRAKTTSVTGITIGDSVNKIYTETLNLENVQARHLDFNLSTCASVIWDGNVFDGQSLTFGVGTPAGVGIAVDPALSDFTFRNKGADAGSIDLPTDFAEVETILLKNVSTDADMLIQNIIANECIFRDMIVGEGDGILSPDVEIPSSTVFGPEITLTPTLLIEGTEVR